MTTDKELLEFAQKAIGFDGCSIQIGRRNWNPLTSDGDAFRLAVRLQMLVNNRAGWNEVAACLPDGLHTVNEKLGNDHYAATRRAIVRVAAAIGAQQPADNTDIHSCSYSCNIPACIKAQRDELAALKFKGNV